MDVLEIEPSEGASSKRADHSGLWNSVVGTIGLILAGVICYQAGVDPEGDRSNAVTTTSLGVLRWEKTPIFGLCWSPDGRKLAASGFGPTIRLWDIESRTSIDLETGANQPRFVIGWSPDGGRLMVGGMDVPVESWDVVNEAEISPEVVVGAKDKAKLTNVLAAISRGRSIRLWGPADGRLKLLPVSCQTSNIVSFSMDGCWMGVAGREGVLRVWDLATGRVWLTLSSDFRGINSLAFSPDSTKMAAGGGGAVRVWDLATGRLVTSFGDSASGTSMVDFSGDGRRLAGVSWDGSIRVWDVVTAREQARFEGHHGQIVALAWSPDGKTLASGGYDSTVRIWDAPE